MEKNTYWGPIALRVEAKIYQVPQSTTYAQCDMLPIFTATSPLITSRHSLLNWLESTITPFAASKGIVLERGSLLTLFSVTDTQMSLGIGPFRIHLNWVVAR